MEKLIFAALLSGSLCIAQTVPTPVTQPDPAEAALNAARLSPGALGYSTPQNAGQKEYQDPLAAGANWANPGAPGPEHSPAAVRRPLITRSEFEGFAEDAAGQPLAVYGRQLFDEVPTTFSPMDRIPVPANYAIGPGDELLIRVWGKVELQARVSVDRNGQIFIPKVGIMSVAGLRYEQVEGYIRSSVANLYKDFDLSVTMGQLRSVQIFVLGSARQPGVYTVSSLSTLVNALFASGGPSATGSMRRIQLRRGNQVVTEFDVYNLLRNGDKSHDAQLLPGDVIYVPPIGPQIAILGSVNEPGIYELSSDSTIACVLKDVAGLTNLASADRALLERVENHRRRRVDEFALDEAGLQRQLKDGDILRVFPISPRFENAVTLRGNVAQPGRYLWHEGMRVSDLIPARDSLLTREYWYQQNFLASTLPPNSNALQLLAGARPQDITNGQMLASAAPYEGGIDGSNTRTNNTRLPIHEHWDRPRPPADLKTNDIMADMTEASTEINWDYALIERRDDNDLSTRLIAFNLGSAVDRPTSTDNQPLKPGDVITIFSRKDIPLSQDKHASFVRVAGEVNAPGVYRINPGETLRDLVVRAGGLTPHSYLYASQLTRASTRLAQEEELKISTAQMQRELSSRYASASSLTPTNTTEQQAQLNAQQSLIAQLATVHPTGRIVLDMKPDAVSPDEIPSMPLEDGDNYYVPARLSTVQVSGAVYNENAFRYQLHERLSTYLKAAGGATRQADTKRIFVIRADGAVVSRQHQNGPWGNSFESLPLLPGDAIVVPTKLKSPNNFMQQLPYLTQILSQTAMTGAVIGTR